VAIALQITIEPKAEINNISKQLINRRIFSFELNGDENLGTHK